MAYFKDDSEVLCDDSLDWGCKNESSTHAGPSSRYDPNAMSRIVDINDLVDEDDSDDDDDDDEIVRQNSFKSSNGASSMPTTTGAQSKTKKRGSYIPDGVGSILMYRQVLILVALVGIIAAASVAIGYTVIHSDSPNKWMPSMRGGDASLQVENSNHQEQQQLLELAERVIAACAESQLDESMSECQRLCHGSMCCFEDESYSCEDDETKNCGVYAGCDNLIEGLGAAEEDEK